MDITSDEEFTYDENLIWVKREEPIGIFCYDEDHGEHWVLGINCKHKDCVCMEMAEYEELGNFFYMLIHKETFEEAPKEVNGAELVAISGCSFIICYKYMEKIYNIKKEINYEKTI